MKRKEVQISWIAAAILLTLLSLCVFLCLWRGVAFAPVAPRDHACTLEAKQCPDGSYVGRSGPNCEFSACPAAIVPYRATLEGEYICLPHRDQSGPQTEECAFGIKTAQGNFALDLAVLQTQALSDISVGQRIRVEGLVTPIEMLSSDHWRIYDMKGIMTVASASVL